VDPYTKKPSQSLGAKVVGEEVDAFQLTNCSEDEEDNISPRFLKFCSLEGCILFLFSIRLSFQRIHHDCKFNLS
jgi:hypothetical protein